MVQTVIEKQCTMSKLGWVHQVHTLNPSCVPIAPRPRARRRVVVRVELYHGAHETVSWPPPGRVAGVPCRVAERTHALLCAVSQATLSYRSTGPAVSQHCIATRPAAKPSSCHDTSDCIVTCLSGEATLLSQYN